MCTLPSSHTSAFLQWASMSMASSQRHHTGATDPPPHKPTVPYDCECSSLPTTMKTRAPGPHAWVAGSRPCEHEWQIKEARIQTGHSDKAWFWHTRLCLLLFQVFYAKAGVGEGVCEVQGQPRVSVLILHHVRQGLLQACGTLLYLSHCLRVTAGVTATHSCI